MGRWWPHRGTIIGWKGGRLWGIILARFRRANEETASSSICSLLLYSRRTRASGDWIWELGVGHGGAGHSPSCGQPPSVGVLVEVVVSPPPLQEQPDCQGHYDGADRNLRGLLQPLRQVASQQHEREPDQYQRRAVAEGPGEAHEGSPLGLLALLGGDKGGDGGKVVRVRSVSQAQQQTYQQHGPQRVRSVHETFEPDIYGGHGPSPYYPRARHPA